MSIKYKNDKMKTIIMTTTINCIEDIDLNKFKDKGLDGWAVRTAKQILKQTKKYKIECWAITTKIKKLIETEVDGVKYKLYPSIGLPSAFGNRQISIPFLKDLIVKIKEKDTLLHFHSYHCNYLNYSILLFSKNTPIIAQHHGSTHPLSLIKRRPIFTFAFPLLLIEELIEFFLFRKIKHFFVLTENEKKDLLRYISPNKIEIQTMGVDFNSFKPIKKNIAKKILNLPLDKKIILYVGRYFESKGVDKILDAFKKIKKEEKGVSFIVIGGYKNDPLYGRVKKEATAELGKIDIKELKQYFSAADCYVIYCNEKWRKYDGMGVAPMEALASGTPIVSTNLIHCPKERNLLGKCPTNEKELEEDIVYVLNYPNKYLHCRAIAKKYFDWRPIIKNTIKVYDQFL